MESNVLPKAWENLINSYSFLPVIVKTIEIYYDANWSMQPNTHEFFEMVYIKKGDAIFEIEGKPVKIGPNDIMIIKPQRKHKFIINSKSGCEFIVLSFKFINKFNNAFSEISLEEFLNFVSGFESGDYIKLKVSQKNDIIVLLNKVLKEKETVELDGEFLQHILVMELFVYLSRALKMEWEMSIKSESSKLKELIKISVGFINNNFERDISLTDISKFVFLSTSYFIRVFKDEMGMSPINYLLKVRIERAKELLAESEMKISEIALAVGFSNQQRFNDIFKKYTNFTPMQYKKVTNVNH